MTVWHARDRVEVSGSGERRALASTTRPGLLGRMAVGSALCCALGCGTARFELLEKRFDVTERENGEIKKQLAQLNAMLENLETELFLLKDRLETAERNRARRIQSPEQLPELRVKPDMVTDRYDPMNDRPAKRVERPDPGREPPCDELDRITADGRRIPGCAKDPAGPAAEPEGAPPPKSAEPVQKKASRSDKDAKTAYDQAMADLKAGRYNVAVDKFLEFVERWPAHEYADNSLYWAGEAYYTRSLWNKALDYFLQVVEVYPMENKTADAMLKIGLCQMNLGNPTAARNAFESVIQSYPDSPVANLAKQKLESL